MKYFKFLYEELITKLNSNIPNYEYKLVLEQQSNMQEERKVIHPNERVMNETRLSMTKKKKKNLTVLHT